MTSIKTTQSWLAPIVGMACLTAALSIALGIALYFSLLPVPALWIGLGLSALCTVSSAIMLIWIKQAIAAPLKLHETRLTQALSRGLKQDAFDDIDTSLSGLGSALDHHACAMRAAFIDISEADLSDGRQAVHLRFSGDAAARLDQLAASVEASDAWLRQRQDTLISLHTHVAEQAVAATQTLKDLSDKDRSQQTQIDHFLAGTPVALAQIQAQMRQWEDIDPNIFASLQAQLSEKAGTLEATLSALELSSESVRTTAQTLSIAADQSQDAVTDLNSAAGTALADVGASTSALAAASDEAGAAARKLSLLATGGKAGLIRALKGVSQSQKALIDTARAITNQAAELSASSAEFVETAKDDRSDMRAAMTSFSGAADAAAEKLHSEIETAIGRNQAELMNAAAAVKDEARAVVHAGMKDIMDVSKSHANALSKEMAAIDAQGALLSDARAAAHSVNAMLNGLQGQASKSQSALEAMLKAQDAAMVPLEMVSARAGAHIETLLKVDSDHIGKVIADIETVTQKLNTLEDMQAAPKLEMLQSQLGTMHAALADGFEAQSQSHGQAIAATQTAVDTVALHLSEKDGDDTLQTQLIEVERHVLERIGSLQSTIVDAQTGTAQAARKATARALRTPLRQLGDQLKGQNDALRASLKDMRTTQLQPIKRSVRDLPDTVAERVLPALTNTVQSMQQALEQSVRFMAAPSEPETSKETSKDTLQQPDIDDAAASLSTRLDQALCAMDTIEAELTSLATAALAVPETAGSSDALNQTMKDAEAVLSAWGSKLDNISTAIAMAQDAA